MIDMKLTKKEAEIYWRGFWEGQINCLEHNIAGMKSQLKFAKQKDAIKRK